MFTGLVRERGRLIGDPLPSGQGGRRLRLACSEELWEGLPIGSSLAVSGVCLTVIGRHQGQVEVELSPETLGRTTLGGLRSGDEINLEPALRMGEPLGGHWVQGHVDATIEVVGRKDLEEHREVAFGLSEELAHFVVEKGSVAIDGVSLTVAGLEADRFTVALIPHTLEVTTLGGSEVGQQVNLEVDILAKYVQRAVEAYR